MKRWLLILSLFAGLFGGTRNAHAYFSLDFGLTDNDEFGYGVGLGMYTPAHVGFETKFLGYWNPGTQYDVSWFRSDLNLFYDFNAFMPEGKAKAFFPKALLGFGYGSFFLSNINVSGTQEGIRASHGPGLSFGTGIDWKLEKVMAIGVDIFESVHWLEGSVIGANVLVPDETRWGFNMIFSVKVFDL